ncbi:hypothetical protein, partial [Roseovarius sp. D0-M9]|uniref:hypothetical protein n=1 Tax=Roseovarius sp. D0-M9 TaxID=3127117 RepID=UPI003010000E
RRSAQAPARVTLRHNIWCGRELTGDPHTHTNREEARYQGTIGIGRTGCMRPLERCAKSYLFSRLVPTNVWAGSNPHSAPDFIGVVL